MHTFTLRQVLTRHSSCLSPDSSLCLCTCASDRMPQRTRADQKPLLSFHCVFLHAAQCGRWRRGLSLELPSAPALVSFKVRIPNRPMADTQWQAQAQDIWGTIPGTIQSKNDTPELSRTPCSATQGGHSQAPALG